MVIISPEFARKETLKPTDVYSRGSTLRTWESTPSRGNLHVRLKIPSGELTFCHGKIHHFLWGNPRNKWPFSIAFCMFTRGYITIKSHYIPLNPIKPPFSYGFPMVFPWSVSHTWLPAGVVYASVLRRTKIATSFDSSPVESKVMWRWGGTARDGEGFVIRLGQENVFTAFHTQSESTYPLVNC